MKDNEIKHIIEDLLPLYEEGLVSEETAAWIEEKANKNKEYKHLLERSAKKLPKEKIEPPVNTEKMFKQINQKVALYQMIFLAISFFLAINTSLLNESLGFVLSYTILGCVAFLFYKDLKIIFYISFLPIFFWSIGSNFIDYNKGLYIEGLSFLDFLTSSMFGSFMMSVIHMIFAMIGAVIAWLVLKLQERN